jgi:hypothetical protein
MSLSLEHAKEARIMKKKKVKHTYTSNRPFVDLMSSFPEHAREEPKRVQTTKKKKRRRRMGSGCARDKRTERWFSATSAGVVAIPLHTNKIHTFIHFIYTYILAYPYSNA